jgi:hypothetical protein
MQKISCYIMIGTYFLSKSKYFIIAVPRIFMNKQDPLESCLGKQADGEAGRI